MTPTPSGAHGVRQARIARVRMIRRRAIAGALALFVATWMLITLLLVTGHDPALARQRTASVQSASTSTTTPSTTTPATSSTTTTATATATTPASSSSSGATSSSGVGAVTSSQS